MRRDVVSVMRRLECQLMCRCSCRFGFGFGSAGWGSSDGGGGERGGGGGPGSDGQRDGSVWETFVDGSFGASQGGGRDCIGSENGVEGVGLRKWGSGLKSMRLGRLMLPFHAGRGAACSAGAEANMSVGLRP